MKINSTKQPLIPEGWKIESHDTALGKIDLKDCTLYLSEKQKNGYIKGIELQKELKNPLNATVLDYLLEHQELIPEEWNGKYVYFWGTVYRNPDDDLCVRCLSFDEGRWDWDYGWLGDDWYRSGPAVVLASPLEPKSLETSLPLRVLALEEKMEKIQKFLILD